jgi:hypothetical protein
MRITKQSLQIDRGDPVGRILQLIAFSVFLIALSSAKSEADESTKEPRVDHGYSSGVQAVDIFYFPLDKGTIPISVRSRSTVSGTPNQYEVEPLICIQQKDNLAEITIDLLPPTLRTWIGSRLQERLSLPANITPQIFPTSLTSIRVVISDKNGQVISLEKERPGDRMNFPLTTAEADRLKTGIEYRHLKIDFEYEKMAGATSYASAGANRRSGTRLTDEMRDGFEKKFYFGLKGELEARTAVQDVVTQIVNLAGTDSAKLLPMLADGIASKVLSTDLRDIDWVKSNVPSSDFQALSALLSDNRKEEAQSNTKGRGTSVGRTKTESTNEGLSFPFIYNRDKGSTDTSASTSEQNESTTLSTTRSNYDVEAVRVTRVNVSKLESELASLYSISFSPSLSPIVFKGNPHLLLTSEVELIAERDLTHRIEIETTRTAIAEIEALQLPLREQISSWMEADKRRRESLPGILNSLIQSERNAVRGNFFVPHLLEWQVNCEVQSKRGEVQHIRDWMNAKEDHESLSRFDTYERISRPKYISAQNALNACVTEIGSISEHDRLQKLIDQFHSNADRLRDLRTKLIHLLQK